MGAKLAVEKERESSISILNSVLKGAFFALAISLIGVLLFAFIIKLTSIDDTLIAPINQVIKGISILMGCFYGTKQARSNGLLKGVLIGLVYTILSFFIFSLLNGQLSFQKSFINDILFGAVIGAICGVISINMRR